MSNPTATSEVISPHTGLPWAEADLRRPAEQVLSNLGSHGLSAEVAFYSQEQIGPFIEALGLTRAANARTEGRPKHEGGLKVIDGMALASCSRDVKAEMALYDDIVNFEYDGRSPAASKLFVVDAGAKRHLHINPNFQPVQRLARALNDPERARFFLLTRQDSKGLKLFRRQVALNFAVSEEGELAHVDHSADEMVDPREAHRQKVAQNFENFLQHRELQMRLQHSFVTKRNFSAN